MLQLPTSLRVDNFPMKRAGRLYQGIASYENICHAFCKAAKGKRDRPEVQAFQNRFHENIHDLLQQFRTKQFALGDYHFFEVQDPKPRTICAAPFPERIMQHSVMNICEPVLEAPAIADCYACRTGKGPQKAVMRAQSFSRRFAWYLQLDIQRYFDSIDHGILVQLLQKKIKDTDVLDYFQHIVSSYCTNPGKGLPIGNLVSQHLANYYLAGFDHWVKEVLRVRGYVRYMDDFLLFAASPGALKEQLKQVRDYLRERLDLRVKPEIRLNRCTLGLTFLGYRIFPWKILLSARSKKRFARKYKTYTRRFLEGSLLESDYVQRMTALTAFTQFAEARGFRQSVIKRIGAPL